MGDAGDITRGGIIAVDPDALRAWRGRVQACAVVVRQSQQDLLRIPALLQQANAPALPRVWAASRGFDQVGTALDRLAVTAGDLADVYELAELRAQNVMLRSQDPILANATQRRIDEMLAANPRLAAAEQRLRTKWQIGVADGFTPAGPQPWWADGPITAAVYAAMPAAYIGISAVRMLLRNLVLPVEVTMRKVASEQGLKSPAALDPRPGEVLVDGKSSSAPKPGDIRLRPDPARTPRSNAGQAGSAPATLSEAVARTPSGSGAQVRVEKYTLTNGSTRFIAYFDGTRSQRIDSSSTEPWDMRSNTQMYLEGAEADSYKAAVAALADAGADSTTPVDLVGYSQGGMIAELIAQSGKFPVQGVFTAGSPAETRLPGGVFEIAVRHTDDPVAGLSGGGSPGGTSSPDSLVISRSVAPGHGVDPGIPAHRFDAYQETIRRAQASGDPRLDAFAAHFAALDGATMTATDYAATRVVEK